MSMGLAAHPLPVHAAANVLQHVPERAGMDGGAAGLPGAATAGEQSKESVDDEPAVSPRGSCDAQFWSCPGSSGFKVRDSTRHKHIRVGYSSWWRWSTWLP